MSAEKKKEAPIQRPSHLRLVEKQEQPSVTPTESFGTVSGLRVRYTGETQATYRGKESLYLIEWLEGPRKGTCSLTPIEPKEQ